MMIDLLSIDLFLSKKNAILVAVITVMNLAGIIWFIREYIAVGQGGVMMGDKSLHFSVGTVYRFDVPTPMVETATRPTWKDIPQPGFPEAKDFLLLTRQASPNVLFRLRDQLSIALPMGRKRMVKRIAIHLDEPDAFMTAFNADSRPNG